MDVRFPDVTDLAAVPTGDMPGDKVQIEDTHVAKARVIFPELWRLLDPLLADGGRAVVAVCGGSGVGKSEIGSLLAYGLNALGVGAYVLSGDNYPRRIPAVNDAERLRTFRVGGVQGLVARGAYDGAVRNQLAALVASDRDADPAEIAAHPWLSAYQKAGRRALAGYLGTPAETDFDEVSGILAAFHAGAAELMLKRMGRTPDQLWYDAVDVRDVRVVVVEWTHGNSDQLTGVDIPVLLNSTPEETLAHRRSRSRDGAVDSPFTTMVLEIEQEKLRAQAPKARIIVAKSGELLDYDGYLKAMGADLPGAGVMLNVYPDSIGGTLADLVAFVRRPELADVFSSAYLLPSVFNTDLDRGFSVIDYSLSEQFATAADLDALAGGGYRLRVRLHPQPRLGAVPRSSRTSSPTASGRSSPTSSSTGTSSGAGHGELTPEGYVQPDPELIRDMFFRKPGLPILMVRLPDGTEKPYWNTFYQEVRYTAPGTQDLMRATGLQYGRAEVLSGRVAAALASGQRPGEADFRGFELVRGRGGRPRGGQPHLPRPDGSEHRQPAGLGVLRRHPRQAGRLRRADRPAGRLRVRPQGAGAEELPQRPRYLGPARPGEGGWPTGAV